MTEDAHRAGQVYIATRSADPDAEMVLELRATGEDDLAVMVYSSLGKLVAACGDHQPWVLVPLDWLPELVKRSGADRAVWDQPLTPEQQHQPPPVDGPAPVDEEWTDDKEALRAAFGGEVVTSSEEQSEDREGNSNGR